MRLSEITRADVQGFADRLTGEGLSPSTVQNTLDPLPVVFRRAIRRDVVSVDPTEHLELRRPKGKSGAAARGVPILESLARDLAAHLLRLPPAGNPLVFGLTAEQPFVPSTVRYRALAASEAANEDRDADDQLNPIGLHEARHCCASVLIASGANAKVIQRVMGHASITETFDRYGHLMPGGLEEAAAAANAYLARSALSSGRASCADSVA